MGTVDRANRYRFALHTRRLATLTLVFGVVLAIFGLLAILSTLQLLPVDVEGLIILYYILAALALAFLLPILILRYYYAHSGIWVESERVRVHFPGENEQEMAWSEAHFAVNEGEEYLLASKGKEGLGHLFGETRYIRLHLEGIIPGERAQIEQELAEHLVVRRPRRFTLMTLLNTKGQLVARGRLYLFENELLCAENRGEKRVFFDAPLKDLYAVRQRAPFYIGKLECEAFTLSYRGTEYVVMLGYETILSGGLGNSSHWIRTGDAAEWVEALHTE
jgi:hypothetical protein